MCIEPVEMYKTADGKIHESEKKAQEHIESQVQEYIEKLIQQADTKHILSQSNIYGIVLKIVPDFKTALAIKNKLNSIFGD